MVRCWRVDRSGKRIISDFHRLVFCMDGPGICAYICTYDVCGVLYLSKFEFCICIKSILLLLDFITTPPTIVHRIHHNIFNSENFRTVFALDYKVWIVAQRDGIVFDWGLRCKLCIFFHFYLYGRKSEIV